MVYLDKVQFDISTTMTTQTSSPSLSDSSPSLTQSMSNSSNSPPLPSTPPPRPSRTVSRYPDNLGRVPLHRRGNSQTYERLEDLLREAGYKETRIFTPEGEHEDVTYHEQDHESPTTHRGKGGVGAVVNFLTGLLPSSTTHSIRSVATTKPEDSPENQNLMDDPATAAPASPSSGRPSTPALSAKTQRPACAYGNLTPRTAASSMENLHNFNRSQSPIMGTPALPSPSITSSHSPYYSRYHPHSPHHQSVQRVPTRQGSSQNLDGTGPSSRQISLRVANELPQGRETPHQILPIAQPHPSRATAYLRRMASQRDVPQRPSSTPARSRPRISLNDNDTDIVGDKGNGEGEEDHRAPPLPRSWLESVARAMLSGGSAAHIGGPLRQKPVGSAAVMKLDHPISAKGRAQALRHTRSSLSQVSARPQVNSKRSKPLLPHGLRNMLIDQTNKSQPKLSVHNEIGGANVEMLGPPELFLRVGRGRAAHSESQVYPTRVYCRSAPSSRPASVVRDGRKDKGLLKGQGRARGGGKTEKNPVPSLAKTKAEGDMWTRPKKRKTDVDAITNRALGGGGGRPRILRQRHQASIRLGDGGYGSDAAAERGYGRFNYGPVDDHHSDEDEEGSDEYDDEDEDDDEDEGELDLARMLVPAKRQNSIISLRKHLAATISTATIPSSGGGGSSSSRATVSASRLGEGIGVGEFEREIEGGGGASAALSRYVGSASTTMPAMRISAAGSGPGRSAAKRRHQ